MLSTCHNGGVSPYIARRQAVWYLPLEFSPFSHLSHFCPSKCVIFTHFGCRYCTFVVTCLTRVGFMFIFGVVLFNLFRERLNRFLVLTRDFGHFV